MEQAKREELFATAKTFPLIVKFSIPTIVGMLITSLNVFIDRIFVGNIPGGDMAIAGVTVSLPVITLIIAIAMLTGAGSGANISLALGRGQRDEARRFVATSVEMAAVLSAVAAMLFLCFIDGILRLFGSSEAILPYARAYLSVSLVGSIINTIGFSLNRCVLSQGLPTFSMMTNILSVAVNMALDPLFLFVFKLGVAGAAWATFIAQCSTLVWLVLLFALKKTPIRPRKSDFRLKWGFVGRVASLGVAPAFLQFMLAAVNIILNNALGAYGGDVAIAAVGIVVAIQNLAMMPVFGINQGIQPIIGFNYGAKHFDRVRRLLGQGMLFALCVIAVIWGTLLLFAEGITSLFGATAEVLVLAAYGLRIIMLLLPLAGLQAVSANYFLAVGRPVKSLLLTALRQGFLYIPMLLILPRFFGLDGVLYAAPASDLIAAIMTAAFILLEMRRLKTEMDTSRILQ